MAAALPPLPSMAVPLLPEAHEARARLYSVLFDLLEEHKVKAFQTAFVTPTVVYYRALGDKVIGA